MLHGFLVVYPPANDVSHPVLFHYSIVIVIIIIVVVVIIRQQSERSSSSRQATFISFVASSPEKWFKWRQKHASTVGHILAKTVTETFIHKRRDFLT